MRMMSTDGADELQQAVADLAADPAGPGRALLDLTVAAAGIGTFDWDLSSGVLRWDERLLELFGYDAADFTRSIESFTARLHPDDVERVSELLQAAIGSVGEYAAEYRVLLPEGTQRWLAARGRALADETGTAVRLLGAAWDVTDRRLAQDRLAALVESMAVGFIALDRDWRMTHLNAEAERITGSSRTRLLGRSLWEAFPAAVGTDFETHYRRAADTGTPVVFDAYYPQPLDVWVEVRAVPAEHGLALYFVDISARRRAQREAERAAVRERLLSRISAELSATLDAAEAARRLTRLVVPALADWAVVTLIDDERAAGSRGGVGTSITWHTDPQLRPTVAAYARAHLGSPGHLAVETQALQTGQPQVIALDTVRAAPLVPSPSARRMLDRLASTTAAVLPLPGREGPVGLLTLGAGAGRDPFGDADLVTVRHVAARAGLVLDNARLYRQQRALAEGFQRSLLTEPVEPAHVQIVVRYVPAGQAAEVGGDWYDAFLQPSGATMLAIGDVVGHDTQAAAAMGQARTIVRALAARDAGGPAEVLTEVEQVMHTLHSGILATAVLARLEQDDADRAAGRTRLRWSNAGHPPPMVVLPDGRVQVLDGDRPQLLLGVHPDTPRRESSISLPWDSVVLLYTDGLVENRRRDLDHGLRRLQALLTELAGADLDRLCDELLARMLPADPDDDVALIAVQLHRQDRPRPPHAGPNRIPFNIPSVPAPHPASVGARPVDG